MSLARGEQDYYNGADNIPTATEGCKSNALMRCCKDLGVASELWDPNYITWWKSKFATVEWVAASSLSSAKKLVHCSLLSSNLYPSHFSSLIFASFSVEQESGLEEKEARRMDAQLAIIPQLIITATYPHSIPIPFHFSLLFFTSQLFFPIHPSNLSHFSSSISSSSFFFLFICAACVTMANSFPVDNENMVMRFFFSFFGIRREKGCWPPSIGLPVPTEQIHGELTRGTGSSPKGGLVLS